MSGNVKLPNRHIFIEILFHFLNPFQRDRIIILKTMTGMRKHKIIHLIHHYFGSSSSLSSSMHCHKVKRHRIRSCDAPLISESGHQAGSFSSPPISSFTTSGIFAKSSSSGFHEDLTSGFTTSKPASVNFSRRTLLPSPLHP